MSGPAMLLQQAARHARFAAAAGWPEVLTPGELAALQYPHDDTPEGKKRARVQQRDFYTLAASAIKAGELAAESAQREKSVYQKALEVRSSRDPWISSLASDEWLGRDFGGGRMRTVLKPVKETIEVQALRPVSVAAWLARISEQPSRFVFAWLLANGAASEKVGAGGTAADEAGKAKTGGRPKGQQGELLQKIIDALAAWANGNNETFDASNMPGQVGSAADDGSFHWLCAKLYPGEFTKGEKAFKGYRAGRCTFPAYAQKSDFYSRAIGPIAQTLGVSLNVATMKQKGRKAA